MEQKEIISLIIYGNQNNSYEVSVPEMQEICTQLASGFTAFGYYHSHTSQRKGGRFSPHIHLVIAIPRNEFQRWQNNVELGFKKSGLDQNFQLCNPSDPRAKVYDLNKLMNYLAGSKRIYLPEPTWTLSNEVAQLSQIRSHVDQDYKIGVYECAIEATEKQIETSFKLRLAYIEVCLDFADSAVRNLAEKSHQ